MNLLTKKLTNIEYVYFSINFVSYLFFIYIIDSNVETHLYFIYLLVFGVSFLTFPVGMLFVFPVIKLLDFVFYSIKFDYIDSIYYINFYFLVAWLILISLGYIQNFIIIKKIIKNKIKEYYSNNK